MSPDSVRERILGGVSPRVLRIVVALALVASCAATRPAVAGDPPGSPAAQEAMKREVDKLLVEIASDRFEVREAARQRLSAIARSAREALEARKDDPDPEIRRTVASLLERLGQPDTPPPTTTSLDLSSLGLVTLEAEGALGDVMKGWDAACGGRMKLPAGSETSTVKFSVRGRPYFEALDALLLQANVGVGEGLDESGQGYAVTRPAEGSIPTAYAGAFRFDVESVSATRTFRGTASRRYALTLRALWSPDVQVVSYSPPTLVKATDAAGKAYRAIDPGNVVYGASGRRAASVQMAIDPEEGASVEQVATLEARWKFRIRHGRQEARFDDLAKLKFPAVRELPPRPGEKGRGTTVTLESLGSDPDRHAWTVGVVFAGPRPQARSRGQVPRLHAAQW